MEEGISYHLIKRRRSGPQTKSFTVEVKIGGRLSMGTGSGRTKKKAAEQEAAYKAILKLKKQKLKRVFLCILKMY